MDDMLYTQVPFGITSQTWSNRLVDDLTWEACHALAEQGFSREKVARQAEHNFNSDEVYSITTEVFLVDPVSGARFVLAAMLQTSSEPVTLGATSLEISVRRATPEGEDAVAVQPLLARVVAAEVPPMPIRKGESPTVQDFVSHARQGFAGLTDEAREAIGKSLAEQLYQAWKP